MTAMLALSGILTLTFTVSAGETVGNFYYNSFSEPEKALYDRIKAAVLSCDSTVTINGITNDRAAALVGKIGDMLLFYDTETWNIKTLNVDIGNNGSAQIKPDYYADAEAFLLMNTELTAAADKIVEQTAGFGTVQKLRYIHDYLLGNCIYTLDTELSGTPYGALVEGKAKCDGYALAFQMIAERAGIPCVTAIAAPGSTGINGSYGHAWNKVKVSKAWYNIDCSSDDTTLKTGKICYDWYMLADSEMGSIHTEWDDPFVTEPNANNTKNSYYEMKKRIAYTAEEAVLLTQKLITANDNSDIAFEIPDKDALDEYLSMFKDGLVVDVDAEVFINPERQIVHIKLV
jgi:hypothetical protein